jgi:hypothetical protein
VLNRVIPETAQPFVTLFERPKAKQKVHEIPRHVERRGSPGEVSSRSFFV